MENSSPNRRTEKRYLWLSAYRHNSTHPKKEVASYRATKREAEQKDGFSIDEKNYVRVDFCTISNEFLRALCVLRTEKNFNSDYTFMRVIIVRRGRSRGMHQRHAPSRANAIKTVHILLAQSSLDK